MSPEAPHDGPARVLLVEDHAIVAEALVRRGQRSEGQFTIEKHATSGVEALTAYEKIKPDVVLCDVQLGKDMTGLEVVTRLTRSHPDARIVMYSAHADPTTVQAALDAGAQGFVSKQSDPVELQESIVRARNGEAVFDRDTAILVISAMRTPVKANNALDTGLTAKEEDLVKLLCNGVTANRALANEMGIAENTVKSYLRRIFHKLDVTDRTAVVVKAFRSGIIEFADDK